MRVRRETFDEVAELYDRARPRHPAAFVEELGRTAGIGPAAGSWRPVREPANSPFRRPGRAATSPRWNSVTPWRRWPGDAFAAFPRVDVRVADFERWDPATPPGCASGRQRLVTVLPNRVRTPE